MANLKESIYYYSGFRNETKPVVIVWEDKPDEEGFYPVQSIRGEFMVCDHFQAAVLRTPAQRKIFNNWLHNELTKKSNNGKRFKN